MLRENFSLHAEPDSDFTISEICMAGEIIVFFSLRLILIQKTLCIFGISY